MNVSESLFLNESIFILNWDFDNLIILFWLEALNGRSLKKKKSIKGKSSFQTFYTNIAT